jgi:hypothetical protein
VEKAYRIIFPIGRKHPTSMFDLGMFPPFGPFGRNFPTQCLGETPFETVCQKIDLNLSKDRAMPEGDGPSF